MQNAFINTTIDKYLFWFYYILAIEMYSVYPKKKKVFLNVALGKSSWLKHFSFYLPFTFNDSFLAVSALTMGT